MVNKIKCVYCNKIFNRKKNLIKKSKHHFCCHKCFFEFKKIMHDKIYTKIVVCNYCKKKFKKLKYKINQNKHNFCSYNHFTKFKIGKDSKRKYNINWKKVAKRYIKEGVSIYTLSKELKINATLIWYHLDKLNVMRNLVEAQKTDVFRKKASDSAKKRFRNHQHPSLGKPGIWKGKKRPEHSKIMTGKDRGGKIIKQCLICGTFFKSFKSQKIKTCNFTCKNILHSLSTLGRKHSLETRKQMSLIRIKSLISLGENKIHNEYSENFNNLLKDLIRERDQYICQNEKCNIPEKECRIRLHIHHIDYNKKNSDLINLISLCGSCNTKANHNRKYWQNYYENIQIKRKVHTLNKYYEKQRNII